MMTRSALFSLVFLHILAGSLLAIFHGPYYGDAENFYSYSESIGSYADFLSWKGLSSVYDYNIFIVSLIYRSAYQSILINSLALILFLVLSSPKFLAYSVKKTIKERCNRTPLVIIFIFLCPSLIFRLGEPSREYLQGLLLFLSGAYLLTLGQKKIFLFFLSMAMFIRPVAAPIYMFWTIFFLSIRVKFFYKISLLFLFILFIYFSGEIEIIRMYFDDKVGDYEGVLVGGGGFFYKVILNIFGDINSFLSNRYDASDRVIFFLDYVWRILLLFYLVIKGGLNSFIFIIFSAILISSLYPFPHPRYFVPALFFLAGIIYSRQISINTRNINNS
jgi:hypothetical protein